MNETIKLEDTSGRPVEVILPYDAKTMIVALWAKLHGIDLESLTPESKTKIGREIMVRCYRAGMS